MSSCFGYKNSSRFRIAMELVLVSCYPDFYFCHPATFVWPFGLLVGGHLISKRCPLDAWMSFIIIHTIVHLAGLGQLYVLSFIVSIALARRREYRYRTISCDWRLASCPSNIPITSRRHRRVFNWRSPSEPDTVAMHPTLLCTPTSPLLGLSLLLPPARGHLRHDIIMVLHSFPKSDHKMS